jgi:DNA repair protein RecO (recombination protein O)
MAVPRDYQVEGIVVRHAETGERDRIITLFTRDEGKLVFIARGARKPGSSLGPCVQMLTRGRFQCVRRRALHLIVQAAAIDSYATLKGDLWGMACGLYLAELVEAATVEGAPNQELFDLMGETLELADRSGANEVLLRFFELRLLQQLGFCPSLRRCVNCGVEIRPEVNALSATLGGVLCPDCARSCPDAQPLSVDALKVLRFWLVNSLSVCSRTKLQGGVAAEVEEHLHRFLDNVLQRDVKSRAWLRRLRSEQLLTGSSEASTIARRSEFE